MNFVDALKMHLAGSDTGQLVVKFSEVPHLCKVSVENGQAVYITIGTMNPEETLEYITDKKPLQANFIPGVPPRKRLSEPLNEILLAIAGNPLTQSSSSTTVPMPEVEGSFSETKVEEAISDFIDLVGPLGQVLADRAMSRLGCSPGQMMAGDTFSAFIGALHEEIPEEDRRAFINRHLK